MRSCIFCKAEFLEHDSTCARCGERVFGHFSHEDAREAFLILAKRPEIQSQHCARFRKESFPLKNPSGESFPQNILFDEFFLAGYLVRNAEEMFQEYDERRSGKISSDDERLKSIIDSKGDEHGTIVKVLYVLSQKTAGCGFQRYAFHFSAVGPDAAQRFFCSVVTATFQKKDQQIYATFPNKEISQTVLWDAAAAGYCFKAAEEMVVPSRFITT